MCSVSNKMSLKQSYLTFFGRRGYWVVLWELEWILRAKWLWQIGSSKHKCVTWSSDVIRQGVAGWHNGIIEGGALVAVNGEESLPRLIKSPPRLLPCSSIHDRSTATDFCCRNTAVTFFTISDKSRPFWSIWFGCYIIWAFTQIDARCTWPIVGSVLPLPFIWHLCLYIHWRQTLWKWWKSSISAMYHISIFGPNKSTSFFTSIKYVLPRNYCPSINPYHFK